MRRAGWCRFCRSWLCFVSASACFESPQADAAWSDDIGSRWLASKRERVCHRNARWEAIERDGCETRRRDLKLLYHALPMYRDNAYIGASVRRQNLNKLDYMSNTLPPSFADWSGSRLILRNEFPPLILSTVTCNYRWGKNSFPIPEYTDR